MVELAVLGLLQDGDGHGYDLRKGLGELLGRRMQVSFGSLYPALARLERTGAVRSLSAKAPATPPIALTGALTGERAAFRGRTESLRQRHQERRGRKVDDAGTAAADSDRRRKKTYRITEAGHHRLVELLLAADAADDRVFPLVVAFGGVLTPEQRLSAFRRRRDALESELAERQVRSDAADPYRRSLVAHDSRALTCELAWVDELSAIAGADAVPTASPLSQGATP
jgi:DNA-binding PadR family transcriptional regulator